MFHRCLGLAASGGWPVRENLFFGREGTGSLTIENPDSGAPESHDLHFSPDTTAASQFESREWVGPVALTLRP